MLKNIHIKNFRAIKDLELESLGRFNLISGRNNSSKTTILEAIFVLTGVTNPDTIHKIHLWRDLKLSTPDDLKLIFNGFDFANNIFLEAQGDNGILQKLTISPSRKSSKINSTFDSPKTEDESGITNQSFSKDSIDEIQYSYEVKKQHHKTVKGEAKLRWKPPHDFEWEVGNIPFRTFRCVSISSRINYSANLEARLETLIVNKKEDEIVKLIQKVIDSRVQGLKVLSGRMIYIDIGLDNLVPINVLGDGVRRFLMILLSIYDAKDGLIVIDEIGNGLHHSILDDFWNCIFSAAIEYNVQLFCVTHSIEVIKSFKRAAGNSTISSIKNNVRNYTIRNYDGEISGFRYDFDSLSAAIDEEVEIR